MNRAAAAGLPADRRGGARTPLRIAALCLALTFAALPSARAVNPDEMLSDTALEARARVLSGELRCLVCRNQSIDDSNADLARDLRLLVRNRLRAGDSDQEVKSFIVARYGNFVLLKPPLQWNTALLWTGPLLFFLLAAFGAFRLVSSRAAAGPAQSPPPLSADEQSQLEKLLGEKASQ